MHRKNHFADVDFHRFQLNLRVHTFCDVCSPHQKLLLMVRTTKKDYHNHSLNHIPEYFKILCHTSLKRYPAVIISTKFSDHRDYLAIQSPLISTMIPTPLPTISSKIATSVNSYTSLDQEIDGNIKLSDYDDTNQVITFKRDPCFFDHDCKLTQLDDLMGRK